LQQEQASRTFAEHMQRKNDELKEQLSQIKQKMNTIAMQPVLQGA